MPPPVASITASGLTKSYGKGTRTVPVLRGVDLQVAPGTVFALLGPNGAGKTTAVRILTTLTTPDAGTAIGGGCGGVVQVADGVMRGGRRPGRPREALAAASVMAYESTARRTLGLSTAVPVANRSRST